MSELPADAASAILHALNAVPMNATVGVRFRAAGVGWAEGPPAWTRRPTATTWAPRTPARSSCWPRRRAARPSRAPSPCRWARPCRWWSAWTCTPSPRARGDLRARAEAGPGDIAAAHAAYRAEGRARLVLRVVVSDRTDRPVLRAEAHWYLRARASMAAPS